MKKKILISAGEPSGDLHASNLLKELSTLRPDLEFHGIGCEKMEAAGVKLFERMDKHSIIGLWEVFEKLGFIRSLFSRFKNFISKNKVDLAILVDYPGFNLALAKILSAKGIPVVYYITPQVWAWGGWRVKEIKKHVRRSLVIFDFERDFFEKAGVSASFVGHPLMDEKIVLESQQSAKSSLGLSPEKFTIGLLPGSRVSEVKNILPVMVRTAELLLKNKPGLQFVISRSPGVPGELYACADNINGIKTVTANIYKILSASDFVISASGTVTLQVAIAEKPMILTYITSYFTYIAAKIVLKKPIIGLCNILAGKEIVPEFVQMDATAPKMAAAVMGFLSSPEKTALMKEELLRVKDMLGKPGASKRAAAIISDILKS